MEAIPDRREATSIQRRMRPHAMTVCPRPTRSRSQSPPTALIALYERRIARTNLNSINYERAQSKLISRLPESMARSDRWLEETLGKTQSRTAAAGSSRIARSESQCRASSNRHGERNPPGQYPISFSRADTLLIEPVQLVPKKPVRVEPFDQVKIVADPTTTRLENPISGKCQVR